ncbi:MAG: hypothetical protein U0903_01030 [Planctomycetales bacterium]
MNLFGVIDGEISARDAGCWLLPPFVLRGTEGPPPAPVSGLAYQMLVGSLAAWLQGEVGDQWGLEVRTFPPASDSAETYLEMQLSMVDGLPRRRPSEQNFLKCRLRVSCWSRSRTDLGLAGELSDRVTAALERRTIAVRDYRDAEVPLWGYMKFREVQRTDFSRQAMRELSRVRWFFEVQVDGVAERAW